MDPSVSFCEYEGSGSTLSHQVVLWISRNNAGCLKQVILLLLGKLDVSLSEAGVCGVVWCGEAKRQGMYVYAFGVRLETHIMLLPAL